MKLANLLCSYDKIPSEKSFQMNIKNYADFVPLCVHSKNDLQQIENECYQRIKAELLKNSHMTKTPVIKNYKHDIDDLIKLMLLSAYSYISFMSLKKFNETLEPYPIYFPEKDLVDLTDEFYKSVQFMNHDNRRSYSAKELAMFVVNKSNVIEDNFELLKPDVPRKTWRCNDCRKEIPFDNEFVDIKKFRCPKCYRKGGSTSVGKLSRIKPSRKYKKRIILQHQTDELNRYSQSVRNTFVLIRDRFIVSDKIEKELYLTCFEECKTDFINFKGPSEYKMAIKHYKQKKKNNTLCYLKSKNQILSILIYDNEYNDVLKKIVQCIDRLDDPTTNELFRSAESKLTALKYPKHLIRIKIGKDLEIYFKLYQVVEITANHIKTLKPRIQKLSMTDTNRRLTEINRLTKEIEFASNMLKTFRDILKSGKTVYSPI